MRCIRRNKIKLAYVYNYFIGAALFLVASAIFVIRRKKSSN